MTLGLHLTPKKTRESTSKVRTGCSTCKARRVKCDEAKPVCRRCSVRGRRCEYNTARAAPPRKVITVYLAPMQSQPVLFVNDWGRDFFHHNLAANFDGQFGSNFWSRLVLQLSHSEPSVRHVVSAISVIHQDVESSLRHPAGYVNANPEAQQKWSAAIKSLSARIQADPNSALVPLVCSLLFTCVEFLRGNVEAGMLHVQSGFNILAALRPKSDLNLDLASSLSYNDVEAIENYLVPVFSGLNVLCSLAGRITPPIYSPIDKKSFPYKDITHCRLQLLEISDACIRFIGKASTKADVFQIDIDDLVEQVKLQRRLDAWRDQLDEFLERMQAASNPVRQDALNLLLVHYKVIYIWMRVCTTASETATDFYHTDFEELVCHAEQIIKPDVGMTAPQPLSFDIQILGPLYYATLKCRQPALRRRALEMLQLTPRREGLWNAHHAYATAKRVIELEERHLNGHGLPEETSRLHGLTLTDDTSRVYPPGEMSFDFRKFSHSIVPSPAYPGTVKAVFHTKPWGLSGKWQTIMEYIKL